MNVDWNDLLIGVALGALIGGLIGWRISHYYFKKQELAERLMHRTMELAGFIMYNRNEKGEITGIVHEGGVHIYRMGKMEAKGTVIKGDDGQ